MYILHIETSTAICSVALSQGTTLLAYKDLEEGMNHTVQLAPVISHLIQSASIKPTDLGAIAISSGPGSYTGLRVGSSTAKAMAYSLGIPLISVPTLVSLAQAVFDTYPDADFALPMIDARRLEVYTALYDRNLIPVLPVSSAILSEAFFAEKLPGDGAVVYSCGDGSLKIGDMVPGNVQLKVAKDIMCSGRHLIKPALELLKGGAIEDPLRFVPYYLKPPNITQPRNLGFQGVE